MRFISKLLTLPQAWRNGLVGDSIPALRIQHTDAIYLINF
ncbi:hypothetical protein G134_353 [Lactobacillus delbrueckii subsp. lactis CRL581]|jgi:hypothetical protein|nr:hypothetical protein G134_353 [Lactobacillus delbrueckii subsp. lactis CRL581]